MTLNSSLLLDSVKLYVADYMKKFDASHDFQHVLRVHSKALALFEKEQDNYPSMKKEVVELAAFMHDIVS